MKGATFWSIAVKERIGVCNSVGGGTILVHLFVDIHPILVIANRICSYEVNVS